MSTERPPYDVNPDDHHGGTQRDRSPLYTAFGASRTLRKWAALIGVNYATTVKAGIKRHGSLEAYLISKGIGPNDIK